MIKRTLILIPILALAVCSVAYASGKIKIDATLSEIKLLFNGIAASLGSPYKILNVDGHTYVPTRFVVENMGGEITYDAKSKSINILNQSQSITVDPNQPEVYLSDLNIYTDSFITQISGNLNLPSMAADQSQYVSGLLSFFNSKGKKVGSAVFAGDYNSGANKVSVVSYSMQTTNYSTSTLQIGMYGEKQINSILGDPSSYNDVSNMLDHFYAEFIDKNFGELIYYTTRKNDQDETFEQRQTIVAQGFINDRWWYGDIQNHKISIIDDIAADKKDVAVVVKMKKNNQELNCVDRFILVKQKGEWLISQYESGSPWPEMP